MIPHNYVKSFSIDPDSIKKYHTAAHQLSDIELRVGFKVNHLETVSYEQINNPPLVKSVDYVINSLDNIFCKKSDYYNTKIDIPTWIIFANGHGLSMETIAGLNLDDFKKLLHFLEHKIRVDLFVVKSCYVAGVNVNKIYGTIQSGTQQYYSFPIIVQGLNDVDTSSITPEVDLNAWHSDRKIRLIVNLDLMLF